MGFLNKKLFNSSNVAFGMDISDLSIKVAELREKGRSREVSGYGYQSIPSGSMVNGDIINQENVVSAIKKVIAKSGPRRIRTKRVICALPETKAFLRIIAVPRMKEEELAEAIKWEIEASIPLPIDQVYYDWKVIEGTLSNMVENKVYVMIIAVSQKVADRLIETVEAAGLKLLGLEVESLAQARSLIDAKGDVHRTTLIIDLGDRVAGFIILIGGTPCYTSNIPLSLQSISDSISQVLGMSITEAQKVKEEMGIGSFLKQDPVFRAVKPIMEGLVTEIENSIDFYLTGLRYSPKIDQILVCGGGSNIKGLIPFLSSRLGQEVRVGDPWINFNRKKKLPIVERKEASHYSTAIGLALRGIKPYEGLS